MSDVKAIRYLLANNAGLTAVVPAARIMAGPVPMNSALPAISVSHISTTRMPMIAAPGTEHYTARVQVTVMASSYVAQKAALALVKTALARTRGTINGVVVGSLLLDLAGPDFRDDEAGIYMGSLDYIITYTE